jgi:hypothetical protein
MAAGSRFHLDLDGHSVTVQLTRASGPVEVLVDGKVVARSAALGAGTTLLRAELPGDPPRPLGITLAETGGELRCEMELGGARHAVPPVPLLPERPPSGRSAGPHPLRRLRRSLRRTVRRALSGRH